MSTDYHTSSDDAAIFSINTPDTDGNENDSEDPIGRGASRTGQLDMFRTPLPQRVRATTRGGSGVPTGEGLQLTPGARTCPTVGPGATGSSRKLA